MLKIADSAKDRIRHLCDQFRWDKGIDPIPAIMWLDTDLNGGRFPTGVIIGAYTSAQGGELSGEIRNDNGLEYVLAVADDYLPKFIGKTLSFDGNSYRLD
ncbi:hypothetical protein D3227_28120 [Mesorhizobium waimense]|uniref:Uncharacterized protein n=1 Tax=Mesorhizobium waimense TaxID=1300307 RepID=A0A3A5KGW1_9HYPH|nr:hypothetical protein [Mesorhizobium waimense]RJT31903.1 hypothetical protein D3227_28120 [Mesorhizobium waimense]